MSSDKEDELLDDDEVGDDETPAPVERIRADLSKRRTIDNLLEERRLQRQLADFDFDL
ncbi:hypothetical protein SJI00_12440 [Pseudomonas sp. RP23018S]|uniref:PA3496 family putative envelope integrity protein n=1 Tax=Pseudomonas sp. RP23018S TaxID=3096037 RepID=UPI002ACAD70F|nr:hypothetical protein [Pseudomonas sp. RP23018S]MDZ5603583.1 hypothetical protein [Pseudomonas sp. RP23018S]